jgi:hypothetical protein
MERQVGNMGDEKSMRFPRFTLLAGAFTVCVLSNALAQNSPVGAYLWFSGPGNPASDQDCRDLVARVQPSREKAEMSLWGTIPEGDPAAGSFYLLLSQSRMEPTYGAEGDYDFGDVVLGPTSRNGESPFTLTPDDHPDTTIEGTIAAPPDSLIVVVTWKAIPFDSGAKDRTTWFCRFDETGTQT